MTLEAAAAHGVPLMKLAIMKTNLVKQPGHVVEQSKNAQQGIGKEVDQGLMDQAPDHRHHIDRHSRETHRAQLVLKAVWMREPKGRGASILQR